MVPVAGSIGGATQIVGVLGYPVAHSVSPQMHNAAFAAAGLNWAYIALPVPPAHIGAALEGVRALGLRGVNVTVPLKELVPPYMDTLSPTARAIGAVNTVVVNPDGSLHGDSTDGAGLLAALETGGADATGPGARVVVLGAGGSARAVVYAFLLRGASVVVANRTPDRADALARDFANAGGTIATTALDPDALHAALAGATLLVNTTSVGMHPRDGEIPPVPALALHPGLFVCDLIYNPWETHLLSLARSQGCRVQNGAEMLAQQGAIAWEVWTGSPAPVAVMRAAVAQALGQGIE